MNITVYCGSTPGNREAYTQAAVDLATWIATKCGTLVYGGSNVGLMKVIADTVLDNGGAVIGVEPKLLADQGYTYDRLTKVIHTETVAERRLKMMELGEAFVALPGGLGTLDEITEVIEMMSLGEHEKPCVFYNAEGYYDKLREFLDRSTADTLTRAEDRQRIYFANNTEEVEAIIFGDGI